MVKVPGAGVDRFVRNVTGFHAAKCLAAVLLVSLLSACGSQFVGEPGETERLRAEIIAVLAAGGDLTDPSSPLYPYYAVRVEEGLSPVQRYVLQRSEDEGECSVVERLLQEGLQTLHPELRPLFEDESIGGSLSVNFPSWRNFQFRRCLAHSRRLHFQRDASEAPPQVTFPLDPDIFWDIFDQRPDPAWDDYQTAFYDLGGLAFCDEYVPAMIDLLGPGVVPDRLVLDEEEELFLRMRFARIADETIVEFYSLPGGYSFERVNILLDSLSSAAHVVVLQAVDAGSLQEAVRGPLGPPTVGPSSFGQGFWSGECQRLEELFG